MPTYSLINRASYVAELLNPTKGYVLLKDYFSEAEIDGYRNECGGGRYTSDAHRIKTANRAVEVARAKLPKAVLPATHGSTRE